MRARFFLLACVFASQTRAAESWAQVVINGEVKPDLALVDADGGGVLVRSADAAGWSLPSALTVSAEVLDERTRDRVRIQSRPGVGVEFKDDEQRLEITIAPWLLPANELSAARGLVMPEEGMRAFFVNYDVQAQRGEGTVLAARGEAGMSVGRTLALTSAAQLPGQPLRRLDSQVRVDYPEHQATMMLGDSISRGAALGSAFRFGGIQWATEFATTPDFIPFAVPTMRGVATVPSTVDLMINGTLVAQRDVPAGAFAFNDLPGITGRGAVEMRVRDAFGNESVVTQSFLAAPSVLRQGVNAFSAEAGFVRENYGLRGDRYGDPFASVSARRGLTDRITGEGALQAGRDVNVGSLGAAARLSSLLMVESTVSAGHSPKGNGSAASIRAASFLDRFEVAVQYRAQSVNFPDFARPDYDAGYRREWSGQFSARLPWGLSLAASHIARSGSSDGQGSRLSVLSVTRSQFWGGSLGLQASRVAGPNGQFVWSLMYARQTGAGHTQTVQVAGDPRGLSLTAQTGADTGRGPGFGWQVAGRAGENASLDAHGTMRTQYGYGDAEAAQMGDQHLARGRLARRLAARR